MATAALYNKDDHGGFGRAKFYGACKSKAAAVHPLPIKKRKFRSASPSHVSSSSSSSKSRASADYSEKRRKVEEVNILQHTINDVVPGCGSVHDYERLNVINGGAYGVVYRVRDTRSGEIAAMKDETDGLSVASLREIEILKSLPRHRNIVELKEVVGDGCDGVYVVMEYVEHDLRRYMEVKELGQSEIKHLMKELLEGVKFLHDNMVMHRDIKPPNILVDGKGALKICDFGLSRRMEAAGKGKGRYSLHVGTLAYKAPELLQGKKEYSTAVDMWGVGCTMAELLLKRALFGGQQTQAEQLLKIYGILGPPGFEAVGDMLLREALGGGAPVLTEAGFALLRRLLSYDPSRRITAEAALNHAWFQEST